MLMNPEYSLNKFVSVKISPPFALHNRKKRFHPFAFYVSSACEEKKNPFLRQRNMWQESQKAKFGKSAEKKKKKNMCTQLCFLHF